METVEIGNVTEVKECKSANEANSLLATGEWVVLTVKVEKVRKPVGKEKVGIDGAGNWNVYRTEDRFEIKYEESLETIYVLGKVK